MALQSATREMPALLARRSKRAFAVARGFPVNRLFCCDKNCFGSLKRHLHMMHETFSETTTQSQQLKQFSFSNID